MRPSILGLLFVLATACTGIPEGITPVKGFEPDRYLGKWYEIARLDHSFERGLDRCTAEYSRRRDGGLSVKNRGWSTSKQAWTEAEGVAYFIDAPDEAWLRVSFFGPFFGSYIVFDLDREGYRYAFVASYSKSYLWLLSRTPTVDEALRRRFVETARSLGYDTESLIWVAHEPDPVQRSSPLPVRPASDQRMRSTRSLRASAPRARAREVSIPARRPPAF